ncbi:amino acid adenylation domain-containing protein [Flavobacterium sp.]|uniref:amino acid adenylation domain-containing protein n=1 Tax=Flavobacterium sp. TaxID=239 RepID=UPI003D6C31CF
MNTAIIGLSVQCSKTKGIEDFLNILESARVCIDQPSDERIANSKIDKKEVFYPYGYLERNDYFDYSFFNLSKAEADAMDPMHRMLLQSVCEAIEDSGYSLDYISKQNVGLFISAPTGVYNQIYHSSSPELDFIGGISAMGAGRIAYFLNITGTVMNIDTACSSSLVAVHEAVQKIKNNELDIAIVAGARLLYYFNEQNELSNDAIMTADGQCRAFDNSAAGTAGGEGVAAIILKRADKAINDQDNILSIIKGSAVNHDGNRSNGVTAPSPAAQTVVILKACENSKIPVETIGYIETHGTGTKLGDPIEYKAIKDAFSKNEAPYTVRLGTLKPNIGHLDNLSGLMGIVKAALVLKEKRFFPLANFNSLNEFITEDPNIILSKTGSDWFSDKIRRAGVSSFGLSGTNSHVILEEYIPEQKKQESLNKNASWLKISAKSVTSLGKYIDSVYNYLSAKEDFELNNILCTLNEQRSDYKYKIAIPGKSISEIQESLLFQKQNIEKVTTENYNKIAVLFLSDVINEVPCADECQHFDQLYYNERNALEPLNFITSVKQTLAIQVAVYNYLLDKGFLISHLIGNGSLAKVSKEIIENQEISIENIELDQKTSIDFDKLKIIGKKLKEENTLLIIVGNNEEVSKQIEASFQENEIPVIDLYKNISTGWGQLWSTLYNHGLRFNWDSFYSKEIYKRYKVPTYPFEENSCWNAIINPLLISNNESKKESEQIVDLSDDLSVDETVTRLLQDTLENKTFQLSDDFFELGGNSIVGIQFINRINDLYKINIEFDELFNCYSISEIIDLIKLTIDNNKNLVQSEKNNNASVLASFDLSNSQKRMWVESQTRALSLAYNICMNFDVQGVIDLEIFEKTLQIIVKKHQCLRAIFPINEDGLILQNIIPFDVFDTAKILEYTHVSQLKSLESKIQGIHETLFDLEKGPLFKVHVVQLNENDYKLIFLFHHIIFDGWSTGVFISDFITTYKQVLDNTYVYKEKKENYGDYIIWLKETLNTPKIDSYKLYWQNKLNNINTKLNLGNQNIGTYKGKKLNYIFDTEVAKNLNGIAKDNRATLFTVLLASVRIYLYRLTQENCVVGTPVSGRVKKDFESIIGLFVNTIPLYTEILDEKNFQDCIANEMDSVVKALECQAYPFDLLLEDLKIDKETSLFDVMVVLQNQNNRSDLNYDEIPFKIQSDTSQSELYTRFNLTFTFFEVLDAIELELEYNLDVFDSAFISSFMDNFLHFVNQLISFPQKSVSALELVNDVESERLLIEFNNDKITYPKNKTIVDLIEDQVLKTPDKVALIFDDLKITYNELNEKSNQLANYLLEKHSIVKDDFIGIQMERSELVIIAILGVLKSGAAYVPIDVDYPQDRVDFIKKDSKCKFIIDENSVLNPEILTFTRTKPDTVLNTENVSYVIYTSGSTGVPKGVLIQHESLADYVQTFVNYFDVDAHDAVVSQATIAFDTSIEEIFPILTVGGTLVIAKNNRDFHSVFSLCEKHKITLLSTNPYAIQYLNSNINNYDLSLKTVISGGDVLKSEYIDNLYQYLNVYNTYGPTEATVCATYHKVNSLSNSISIGKPITNKKVYILQGDSLAPIGVSGELCIGGKGLAKGYLNNEELSNQKFIDNPFAQDEKIYRTGDLAKWTHNGSIEFLGRIDNQLKIRGHRIELEEIEKVISDYSIHIQQIVVDAKTVNNEKALVAYIVSQSSIDKSVLRNFLKEKLPSYMIPSFYVYLDEIPLTTNGKIDKKQLPEVSPDDIIRNEFTPAANEVEERLKVIWQENLNVDNIGTTDNFFELGGQSIIAVKVIALINREFTTDYPLDILFHVETIKELSSYIINGYDFKKDYYEYGKISSSKMVFALPPILGYGTAYKNLFNDIEDIKVIAFNFIDKTEDVVSYYANQINELQQSGSIVLFGWSAGGNLSYDIANYLDVKLNRKVSSIVMLDSYAIPVEDSEIEDISNIDEHIKYDLDLQKLYQNDNILENAKAKLFTYLKYMHGIEYKHKIVSDLYLIKSDEPMSSYNWEGYFDTIHSIQGKGDHYSMLQDECFVENKYLIHEVLSKVKNN